MVDFEKAYDSVVLSFIRKSLIKLKFNFGSSITRWISAFIVTLSSVCQLMDNTLNGSIFKEVRNRAIPWCRIRFL